MKGDQLNSGRNGFSRLVACLEPRSVKRLLKSFVGEDAEALRNACFLRDWPIPRDSSV